MSTDENLKTEITDTTLFVRKVQVKSSVLLAHSRTLEKAHARYRLTRIDMNTVTISSGAQSKTIGNLCLGHKPNRVIFGFVSNAALSGSFKRNPSNFQNFGHNYLSVYSDGQNYPSKPLQPVLDIKQYISAYHTLYSGTEIHFQDEGNDISREEYPYGYCLMAFEITPDLSASADHWRVQRNKRLPIEVKFKKALAEAVNCIIYADFLSLFEIDRHRNILIDYSINKCFCF